MAARPLHVGIVVNPVAGLGGAAGLKGSDGVWRQALEAGYTPMAASRASRLVAQAPPGLRWTSAPGCMGVDGLPHLEDAGPGKSFGETTPQDTRHAASALARGGVDLLCFVGGDGTAADVAAAVGESVACLGVPAGVKVTSPVFTHDVDEAAWLLGQLAPGFDTVLRDVTDLDEQAYRAGRLETGLRGALRVPKHPAVQTGKVATPMETSLEALVEMALRDWDPAALHIIGAGSVCLELKRRFWGKPTLLGVDAVAGDRIVAADLDAAALRRLASSHPRTHVWLSPIGGQGMLLGRGTQVLAPDVLRAVGWQNLHVLAPADKLRGVRGLHVDSGDPEWDEAAPPYMRVVTGWNETRMVKILTGARAAGQATV